jgi:hypothetical protein
MIDQPPVAVEASCQTPACWHRVHVHRRARWGHRHPWMHAWHRVPGWGRGMLARLRGCETRGIAYPANYRYAGTHDGAYQYLLGTWLRTIAYLPTRRLRRVAVRGPAYTATPREQDVRTFFFYPSHRGEWECRA